LIKKSINYSIIDDVRRCPIAAIRALRKQQILKGELDMSWKTTSSSASRYTARYGPNLFEPSQLATECPMLACARFAINSECRCLLLGTGRESPQANNRELLRFLHAMRGLLDTLDKYISTSTPKSAPQEVAR
jgi:hypothetical protein